ncbi:MAG: hypothetical protein LBD42_05030 [Desulfovibrio sp.]|jgi:hypothetical protein|nr:hypothetical protein [Desulfovibrio sp.]
MAGDILKMGIRAAGRQYIAEKADENTFKVKSLSQAATIHASQAHMPL